MNEQAESSHYKVTLSCPDIEVSKEDPFKNDLLDRKDAIKSYTRLLSKVQGPGVISVNATWGDGKTTFMKMWAAHLRQNNIIVTDLNVWDSDHSNNPLNAITSSLTKQLLKSKIIDEHTREKLLKTAVFTLRAISMFSPAVINKIFDIGADLAEKHLKAQEEANESIHEFRKQLEEIALKTSRKQKGHPIIVMIDELDRCRPPYAITFLEIAKHLFNVKHVVFVLAINKNQLEKSICAIYGNKFDSRDYLRRFINRELQLPKPAPENREGFVKSMIKSTDLGRFLDRRSNNGENEADMVRAHLVPILFELFLASNISLRRIMQAINNLDLLIAMINDDDPFFVYGVALALILHTVDVDSYQRFSNGEIDDKMLVDKIFDRIGVERNINTRLGFILFEALAIVAYKEIHNYQGPTRTPLQKHYDKKINSKEVNDVERKRCESIIKEAGHYINPRPEFINRHNKYIGYLEAVKQFEFLSPDSRL